MKEGQFIEMIVAAKLVVTDDTDGYHIRREYNSPALISFSRAYLARATDDDIAQLLALHVFGLDKPLTLSGFFKELVKGLFHKS